MLHGIHSRKRTQIKIMIDPFLQHMSVYVSHRRSTYSTKFILASIYLIPVYRPRPFDHNKNVTFTWSKAPSPKEKHWMSDNLAKSSSCVCQLLQGLQPVFVSFSGKSDHSARFLNVPWFTRLAIGYTHTDHMNYTLEFQLITENSVPYSCKWSWFY